jgi:hypothetical protein
LTASRHPLPHTEVDTGRLLSDAFTISPDYLADYKSETVNFSDLGLQLTRTARALKIWLSFNYFGADAFSAAIDRALDLALLAEAYVGESEALELLSPASLGIICFRRRFDGVEDEHTLERLNAELVRAFEATGRGLLSSTRLHGTYAIRLCVMNHTSGPDDVTEALEWFATARRPTPTAHPGPRVLADRHADVRDGWAQSSEFDPATVTAIPLFAELQGGALEVVLRSARKLEVGAGETVVHRWHGTRRFYVIVAGSLEVRLGDERVRELGQGEFFGELAALDWGAGFGYARTATVAATTPSQLLVLTPAALSEVMRRAPSVASAVRAVASQRIKHT